MRTNISREHQKRMLAHLERQQLRPGANPMQTRTYSEKSNARRAARAAGVDPKLVVETEDGFTFPAPAEEDEPPAPANGSAHATNDVDTAASADRMKAAHAEEDDRDVEIAKERIREIKDNHEAIVSDGSGGPLSLRERLDNLDTPAPKDDEGIPEFLKVSAEDTKKRKAAWERNPPKAAPIKPETATMATAKSKKGKGSKSGAKDVKTSSADKTATMLALLKKGATVDALCKATAWLPHTLRARISGVAKPKSKGGEGIKIERERVDGVTSYRVAS